VDFKTLDNLSDREMPLKDNGQASSNILLISKLISKFLNNGPLVLAGTFTGNDLDYLAPVCSKLHKQIIAVDPIYWISDHYKQDFCNYVQTRHIDKTNVTFDWSDIEKSNITTNFICNCSGFGTRIDVLFRQQTSCILINYRGSATDFYNLTKQDKDIYQVLRASSFDIYVKGIDLRDKVLAYLIEQTQHFSSLDCDFMLFRDFVAVVPNRQIDQNNGYQQFIKYFGKDYKTLSF
jgi:hypothetical protein